MEKIKIGILGTSDIAFRRFLPALMKNNDFEYIGVASRKYYKTKAFIDNFGGLGYEGYDSLINDSNIDALYIPLPPALHFKWAMKALNAGKHVLLEKPLATRKDECYEIIECAESRNLAVHENYMFLYHSQLKKIKEFLNENLIGEVRLYRVAFGFPRRAATDFRYNKELGGGALLDCGGYPVKLASDLLGEKIEVTASRLNYISEFDVDIYGTATLENGNGEVAQISFGMDNSYKCELEIWGSEATLYTNRIFTAGDGFVPELVIKSDKIETIELIPDDQFLGSIKHFFNAVKYEEVRRKNYQQIATQANLINKIKRGNEQNDY